MLRNLRWPCFVNIREAFKPKGVRDPWCSSLDFVSNSIAMANNILPETCCVETCRTNPPQSIPKVNMIWQPLGTFEATTFRISCY